MRISWSIGATIYSYLKCTVYDKLLKPRQSFLITLYNCWLTHWPWGMKSLWRIMLIKRTSPEYNNGDGLDMLKINVLHRHLLVHSTLHFYNVLFHVLSCHMFCRILYKCVCTDLCELCLKLYKLKTNKIYCFEEGVPSCPYNQSPTCVAQLGH